MGFPSRTPPLAGVLVGEACERAPGGFVCPRCRALVADLPCRYAGLGCRPILQMHWWMPHHVCAFLAQYSATL